MVRVLRSLFGAGLAAVLPFALTAQQSATGGWLKPTVSLGYGTMAFYGDIGQQHAGHSPLLTRTAYAFRASTPLVSGLDAGLYLLHGRLGANERDAVRNLNFQSTVNAAGVELLYDFHHLLPAAHVVEPWLSVGVGNVWFRSETDRFDAQGRQYQYWSDGTIRDIAESAPNAAEAVVLQRDNTYESSIRDLDLDGFGHYRQRAWSMPVGAGARLMIGEGIDLRLGATMHFVFSDLVDGVTAESRNERAGDARNDRFLFLGASVGLALDRLCGTHAAAERAPRMPAELDAALLNDDEDGDGVPDFRDASPGTAPGVAVDASGTPADSDGDGVPDHLDKEPASARGAAVDGQGVTITDESIQQGFDGFMRTGTMQMVRSRVDSGTPR